MPSQPHSLAGSSLHASGRGAQSPGCPSPHRSSGKSQNSSSAQPLSTVQLSGTPSSLPLLPRSLPLAPPLSLSLALLEPFAVLVSDIGSLAQPSSAAA